MASSYAPSEATSTAGSVIPTPHTNSVTLDSLHLQDDSSNAIPWPENTYAILAKDSGLAITTSNSGEICLTSQGRDNFYGGSLWLCVEVNGYFGFFNEQTGKYLGHNGSNEIHATAKEFDSFQYFIPRMHFSGAYQLLMPAPNSVMQVAITVSGKDLVRRRHAGACWEFIKISGNR